LYADNIGRVGSDKLFQLMLAHANTVGIK